MTSLFEKTNKLSICPYKLYKTYLTAEYDSLSTNAMLYGSFFEHKVLGEGRRGDEQIELPKLKNGNPSITEQRIMEQVRMFDIVAEHYGLIIEKEGKYKNVQVKGSVPVISKTYPDIKITLEGAADLVSPITIHGDIYDFDSAVIDLKLTQDLSNEHGKYAWGMPQYLDVIQLVHYSEIFQLPSFYLVFDYNSKNKKRTHSKNGHRLLPVITMQMVKALGITDHDHPDMVQARQRKTDWIVTVKGTVEEVVKMHNEGYPKNAMYDECATCPLNKINNPNLTDEEACKEANFVKRI